MKCHINCKNIRPPPPNFGPTYTIIYLTSKNLMHFKTFIITNKLILTILQTLQIKHQIKKMKNSRTSNDLEISHTVSQSDLTLLTTSSCCREPSTTTQVRWVGVRTRWGLSGSMDRTRCSEGESL